MRGSASACQTDRKDGAGVVGKIGGAGRSAVKFGDQAHDVEPEAKVRTLVRPRRGTATATRTVGWPPRAAAAGPGLATEISAWLSSARRTTEIVAPSALKSTALSTSLSSICTMRSGAPVIWTGSSGTSQANRRVRKGAAIGLDRGADQGGQIEALTLAVGDGLLDPGGGAHGREDGRQSLAAFAGAGDVHPGVVARLDFGLQVLERRPDDGERRADLVRQLAGQRAQVAGVFVQAAEQRREAARQIAELVGCFGLGQYARHAALAARARSRWRRPVAKCAASCGPRTRRRRRRRTA